MEIKAKVTISRSTSNFADDVINLRISDEKSSIEFVDLKISLSDFALAITGLSSISAQGEVRGLERIGKERVYESRSINCPIKSYNKEILREWLEKNAQEDGWILNSYLGSQNSVAHKDDCTILNYSVTKYI